MPRGTYFEQGAMNIYHNGDWLAVADLPGDKREAAFVTISSG